MNPIPNSGVFNDETLDRLRSDAAVECASKNLPEALIYYLRALEAALIKEKAEHKTLRAGSFWKLPKP